MKKFTKITAVLLVSVLMIATLAGCGKDRLLYKTAKLEKYIEVPEYKGVEIDTNGKEFSNYYNTIFASDIEQKNLYQKEEEGTVNIDLSKEYLSLRKKDSPHSDELLARYSIICTLCQFEEIKKVKIYIVLSEQVCLIITMKTI